MIMDPSGDSKHSHATWNFPIDKAITVIGGTSYNVHANALGKSAGNQSYIAPIYSADDG